MLQEPAWDTRDKHPWWEFQASGCCEAYPVTSRTRTKFKH